MRVLLLTNVGPEVASAREWFYQMHRLLLDRGIDVSLNIFEKQKYDIIIVLRSTLELVKKALAHSPKAHIGILNPGPLGFKKDLLPREIKLLNNVDFFLITTFMWRELLLRFDKRIYSVIDYDDPQGKEVKNHIETDDLILGYHGNVIHYSKDFFPNGANALKRLTPLILG